MKSNKNKQRRMTVSAGGQNRTGELAFFYGNQKNSTHRTFHKGRSTFICFAFSKTHSKRTYIIYKNKNNRLKYRKCVQEEEKQNKRKG